MHNNKYCHHDLKPANLLVTTNGIKLADFGFAKHEDDSSFVSGGSEIYMAPEQIGGLVGSYKSDVWSCGCIALELITRIPRDLKKLCSPDATWLKDIWTKAVEQDEQLSTIYNSNPDIFSIVSRMLQISPEDRPSAEECFFMWSAVQIS
jgi:serine/threonine protein kinase